MRNQTARILNAVTATGAGAPHRPSGTRHAVQVTLSSGTATVVIQVSNDGSNWIDALTFSMSGASSEGSAIVDRPWAYIRANVTALGTPGTDAVSVDVASF